MNIFFWIVEYIACFVEVWMCFYFCGTFINKELLEEKKRKVLVLSVVGALVLIVLNNISLFSPISAGLFMIICIGLLMTIFKRFWLSVGFTLIYVVVLSAIDCIVMLITVYGMGVDSSFILSEHSFLRLAGTLLSKSMLLTTIITINKIIRYNQIMTYKQLIPMSLCSFFLVAANTVCLINFSDVDGVFFIVFFIASIVIELILFYFVMNISDFYEQQKKYDMIALERTMLKKSLVDTERAFDLWRQSIHDYKNNVISLKHLIDERRYEELKEFVDAQNQVLNAKTFYIKTGNSMVDAMVNIKQRMAEEKGIKVLINASVPTDTKISDIDLANIIGNLLDNAIEASEGEEKPYIDIKIGKINKQLLIDVSNRFSRKMDENMKTTKKNAHMHGIGLKSVKRIASTYNGNVSFSKEDDIFSVSVMLVDN